MFTNLPIDIQKRLLEKCPQLRFVNKTLRLHSFTKPDEYSYPTKDNDNDDIIIINYEGLKLEFREGIKRVIRRIENYIEKDNVRSLNTNSIELYNNLWIDIEKLEKYPDKEKLLENWKYSYAYNYGIKQSSLTTYDDRLKFFFNFIMCLYH
jgi:hypothetical protein